MSRREVVIALELLNFYSKNKISYPELVNQLSAVASHLKNISSEKMTRYMNIWEDLELINAIVLDESSKRTLSEFAEDITKQLIELRELLESLETDEEEGD